jgi:putative peptidoglycan lipid II flippase
MSTEGQEAAEARNSASLPKQPGVLRQGVVVSAMTLISRIAGFVRDIVLAGFIGATGLADAFFVAFRIPNFFRRLFAEGAFNQAFVPVLMRYRDMGADELRGFVAVVGGNLTLALMMLVLAGVLFAPYVTMLFAPGFVDDPRFDVAAGLLRITFPYIGFISLVAFTAAILNAHERYAAAAFTPVLLNVVMIASVAIGVRWFDGSIQVLAWGVFVAGLLQWLFLQPSLRRVNLLVLPRPSSSHPGAKQVGRLLIPAVLAASVGQINALVDSMLASLLETGSVSWLYYADRLLELPIGLVAVALGTVLLPNLSRLDARGQSESFARLLDWGLGLGLLLALPAAVALYVLAVPLLAALFLHGEMRAYDVTMAALALQAFSAGLVPMVLVKVLAPAFFAQQDTRTPFRIAMVAIGANILINLMVFSWFGHVGLAFGTTISAFINAGLLWRGLVQRRIWVPGEMFKRLGSRAVIASVAMALALACSATGDQEWMVAAPADRAIWIVLTVLGGAVVYLATLFVSGLRPHDLIHRPG